MKTIWAVAGALCLAARFAQAAPSVDVFQDVGNGVNQISEKSAEAPILSSEVEVEVATPILVSRVSTILTAATPAIYQDAAKNPNELSEKIVKPITLLLNSVSGGVTTLAKDNSRRFFVPSFVRFNFRQDALLELDRIRRTERFWNETEQYVDSVCARLKKYIEVQRRRGFHGVPAPTTSSATAAPPSAFSSTTTEVSAKPSSAFVHVAVKAERPVALVRGDQKLSVHETAEPIKIPIGELPAKRNPVRPLHHVHRPKPSSEPHATVQVAPLKQQAAEAPAPKPINAVESFEGSSAAPSEVPVETTSVPSKLQPSPTSTEKIPETTAASDSAAEVVNEDSVVIAKQSAPLPEVPTHADVKVAEAASSTVVAAGKVPVERITKPTPVVEPVVESSTAGAPQPDSVPIAASRTESSPEPVPVEAETPEVAKAEPGVVAAETRTETSPNAVPDETAPPVATVRSEPSHVVAALTDSTTAAVPAVDVTTSEVPQTGSASAVGPSSSAVPEVDAATDVKQADTGRDQLSVPTVPGLPIVAASDSAAVVVPKVETVTHSAPEAGSPTSALPELVESLSSAAAAAPHVQSSAPEVPSVVSPSVKAQAPEPVPSSAVPEPASVADHPQAPVVVQTPVPEVDTSTKTTLSTESVFIPSTGSEVSADPAVETEKPVEESTATTSQTAVQHSVVSTEKPPTGEVHRLHPVAPSIVFPSKAPTKISQSVSVAQFASSSSSSETPVSFVSSTTLTTSTTKSLTEALRFEQVALSHPIVIRPVKSPLPIAIPHRVIKHSADGVSVVRTQSSGPIGVRVEKTPL